MNINPPIPCKRVAELQCEYPNCKCFLPPAAGHAEGGATEVAIIPTHAAANAFWAHWKLNGEIHTRGHYESTWGAINNALRVAGGVIPHDYRGSVPVRDDLRQITSPDSVVVPRETIKQAFDELHAMSAIVGPQRNGAATLVALELNELLAAALKGDKHG